MRRIPNQMQFFLQFDLNVFKLIEKLQIKTLTFSTYLLTKYFIFFLQIDS